MNDGFQHAALTGEAMSLLCGIDIGGTKLAAGLVDEHGGLLGVRTTNDHSCMDEACVMDLAAGIVRDLCRDAGVAVPELLGVAVGMAGHMRRDGTVLTTSNLSGFKNYPLAAELSSRLDGKRVILENDANCQAWAEYKFGAGRGHDDMVFVTVSTGIGAGLIIGGRLYRGRTGTAGEIGHSIVDPNSDTPCTCGNKGCFMSLACTLNLDGLARKKSGRFAATRIFSDVPKSAGGRLDGRQVMAHASEGDPVALEIIEDYAGYLGIMVYNIFQIFNPSAVVLGGGLMNWGFGYFEKICAKFDELAGDMLYDPMPILKAGVGENSGVIGAAALLLEDS